MMTIVCIIGVVSIISLYDYFSSKNWQNVTSSYRNEVVFLKRNKDYGAYKIRRDYNRVMVLILCGLSSGVGISYAAFKWNTNGKFNYKEEKIKLVSLPYIENFQKDEVVEEIEEHVEVVKGESTLAKVLSFQEFKPSDSDADPIVEIPDGKIEVAASGQEGSLTGGGMSIGDPDGVVEGTVPDDKIYDGFELDQSAEFVGGPQKRLEFLNKFLVYPDDAIQNDEEGICWVGFIVSKAGDVENVNLLKPAKDCNSCNIEAVRLIKSMPRWAPAISKGKPVNSRIRLKIEFLRK